MILIFIRTILLYVVVIFGMRVMGKRQLGELQPSELVVTILISNIATLPIEDTDVPLIGGIIPILTLVCFEVIVSAITLKSKTARRIISGNPRMVIREGVIDQQELKNLRFSIDDLMEQLRTNNIFDIRDVDYAIVETNGKLSLFKRFEAQETTAEMLNLTPPKENSAPPVVVVSDGRVLESTFEYCGIDLKWVEQTVQQNGHAMEEVFLMTCDRKKSYYIVPKEKKGRKGK